uniref:HPr kinase n=1 Tax=Cyanothece sp. (strain PCC 7425 / ATCC 29141) TaxID=395961 RepID=B8HL62_CYAP4
MPQYIVYGLRLNAESHIPGLVPLCHPQPFPADIQVYLGEKPSCQIEPLPYYQSRSQLDNGQPQLQVWKLASGGFQFRYGDGTQFWLSDRGAQIWATWPEDLTLEDTCTYFLGPILAFVLNLRGFTCLHASAIVIENQAIGFCGRAGAGKSTTAAYLAQQGFPILTDDVLTLQESNGQFWVIPAYPRVRLWNASVTGLFGHPEHLPRIVPSHPTWDKRFLDLTQPGYQFHSQPVPLRKVYVLKRRDSNLSAPHLQPQSCQDSLLSLLDQAYTKRLLSKTSHARQFLTLGRLVQQIPVSQLTLPDRLVDLGQLEELLLQDLNQPAAIATYG